MARMPSGSRATFGKVPGADADHAILQAERGLQLVRRTYESAHFGIAALGDPLEEYRARYRRVPGRDLESVRRHPERDEDAEQDPIAEGHGARGAKVGLRGDSKGG